MDAYLIVSDVVASVTISGRPGGREQLPHLRRRPRVVGTDDDAVGVEAVEHGRALPKELGIGDDADIGATDHLLDHVGGAHGHGRLVDDDGSGLQVRRDLLGRRLDVGQVGRAVSALGRRHAQEHEFRPSHGLDRRVGEGEIPRRHASGHQLVESGLHNGHAAGAQRRQPRRLPLGQHDMVAEVGQRRRSGQTDVPGADDGDPVTFLSAARMTHAGAGGARRAGTSRASPSCQSGSAGSPLRRRAMLSSTELAGRGAG